MTTMEIKKAQWTSEGDQFTVTMPMSKIDEENRLVSGWASLDNVDLQGDIVTAEASQKAFARFRGNIREMHQPIAVGRMVSYKPDTYYDPQTEQFYNGIFVTARISKGAQDTWEKVMDGTLSAFSIKGPIIESEPVYAKPTDGNSEKGKTLRRVLDYDLEELSLVDSGGNQFANVVSIMKVNGQNELSGTITESKSENVFYCEKHDGPVAKTSTEDSEECPEGHTMVNIGWIEYDDDNKAAKVAEVIAKHNSAHTDDNAKQELPATNEGGVDVAEETEKTETVDGAAAPEVTAPDAEGKPETEVASSTEEVADNAEVKAPEETVEKAADVSEVEVPEQPDFAKMFGDLQAAITSGLEKNNTDATAAIAEATKVFESKFDELSKGYTELTTKFDSIQTELKSVEKSLAAVEADTAVKKSGDLGGSPEDTLAKSKGSLWNGRFLGLSDHED